MKVVIDTEERIAQHAADQIAALLSHTPSAVLGLATGASPLKIYDNLAARVAADATSFAHARGFTLDEYVGLADDHECNYRNVIHSALVSRVDFGPDAVRVPDGNALDLHAEAADYDRSIAAAGGIDLQILGIGTNGHIAFNEPGSSFESRTRVAVLSEETRRSNARFFSGDVSGVPTTCITQGIGTIMESRTILLIATGWPKAEAVRRLIEGPVSEDCPATFLQSHPDVHVFLDHAAASKIRDSQTTLLTLTTA